MSYWQGFRKHLCIFRSESIHNLKQFFKMGVRLVFELLSFSKVLDQGKCKFAGLWGSFFCFGFFVLFFLSAFGLITGVLVYEEHM